MGSAPRSAPRGPPPEGPRDDSQHSGGRGRAAPRRRHQREPRGGGLPNHRRARRPHGARSRASRRLRPHHPGRHAPRDRWLRRLPTIARRGEPSADPLPHGEGLDHGSDSWVRDRWRRLFAEAVPPEGIAASGARDPAARAGARDRAPAGARAAHVRKRLRSELRHLRGGRPRRKSDIDTKEGRSCGCWPRRRGGSSRAPRSSTASGGATSSPPLARSTTSSSGFEKSSRPTPTSPSIS